MGKFMSGLDIHCYIIFHDPILRSVVSQGNRYSYSLGGECNDIGNYELKARISTSWDLESSR